MSLLDREVSKYRRIWDIQTYHNYSPGERYAGVFLDWEQPRQGQTCIDLGCGTGKGGFKLAEHGLVMSYLDFVQVTSAQPFMEHSLWDRIPHRYDYGFCCDVMEHIPEPMTMLVVRNILDACNKAFFSVSFVKDSFGDRIGERLHLTIKPFDWWRDNISAIARIAKSEERGNEGLFLVEPA